jgi:class 3 adenylate cyclase
MIRLGVESKLLTLLLAVTVASVFAISLIAWFGGKMTLTELAYNQLNGARNAKTVQIEDLFRTVRLQTSNLVADRMIIDMMVGLRQGAADLADAGVPVAWDLRLASYYRDDFLPRLQKTSGGMPIVDAYLPRTNFARYLQYLYLADNKFNTGEKYKLEDAGDGSEWSRVHGKYQAILSKFVLDFGFDNIYLVDNVTGDVVYTFGKSPVFATNLLTGPYSDSNAASLFRTLSHVKDRGMVGVVDFAPFAPALGRPIALAGAAIFDGADQVGILFIQFPLDEINRVMTNDGNWEKDGLGRTGEVYLIGQDNLMRSRSRPLTQDPAGFFGQLEAVGYPRDEIERVRRSGVATLAQRVETTSARQALTGHPGTDIDIDYHGRQVLASYAPLEIPGLHWAIIAEMEASEAFAPLQALTQRVLVSTVVIILLVSGLAAILGRLFVRPVNRLIDGVREIDAGNETMVLEVNSKDEFADLAVAFNIMYSRLRTKTTELSASRRAYELVMARVLPAAVHRHAGHTSAAERFDDASILCAELTGLTELTAALPPRDGLRLLNDLIGAIDDAAQRNNIEKLRTVGGCYLAASGLPVQRLDHAARIVDFARELPRLVARVRVDRGLALGVRIGIASGPVLAGVVGETRMTYDVFGEVVDLAKAIAAAGKPGAVILAASCHELVQDLYPFDPPVEGPLQSGKAATVWPLRLDPDAPDDGVTGRGERRSLPAGQDPAHD